MSVYLQPPGSIWLHCPVVYTCLFIYSHLDLYGCTVQYFTPVCLFTATWIHMAALSSILHMSVYLQPPGSIWLHCPVFYTCLFIYSHLDPYGCTVQYFTHVCLFTATWIHTAAPSSILHLSVYLQPPGSVWLHCPVFYTLCLFTATWIPMVALSSILHLSVYLQPPGSVWLHCPVFYTCLFIYSHLDPYSCTIQYFTCVCILHLSVYLQPPGSVWLHCPVFYTLCLFTATWIPMVALSSILHLSVYLQLTATWIRMASLSSILHLSLFTATWIPMVALSSILHLSVYLQPPGSVWLHRPVFYTCLFIYSHLDPYDCTIQYFTPVCLFTATWICMAALSSILHMSVYLQRPGSIQLHRPVFYTCLFIYSHLDPYGCTIQYFTHVCLFTATWIPMAALSSILHLSVYLQPPGSLWLHRPVFYTCLFIYSDLDPYDCTIQYFTPVCLFTAT